MVLEMQAREAAERKRTVRGGKWPSRSLSKAEKEKEQEGYFGLFEQEQKDEYRQKCRGSMAQIGIVSAR